MKIFRTPFADACEGPTRVHRFKVATRYPDGLVLHCSQCGTLATHGEAIHRFEMFEQEQDAGRDEKAEAQDISPGVRRALGMDH